MKSIPIKYGPGHKNYTESFSTMASSSSTVTTTSNIARSAAAVSTEDKSKSKKPVNPFDEPIGRAVVQEPAVPTSAAANTAEKVPQKQEPKSPKKKGREKPEPKKTVDEDSKRAKKEEKEKKKKEKEEEEKKKEQEEEENDDDYGDDDDDDEEEEEVSSDEDDGNEEEGDEEEEDEDKKEEKEEESDDEKSEDAEGDADMDDEQRGDLLRLEKALRISTSHPGASRIRAERAIAQELKSKKPAIRRLPFERFVREISQDYSTDEPVRWTKEAMLILQAISEQYVKDCLKKAAVCTKHAERDTLYPVDMTAASEILDDPIFTEAVNKFNHDHPDVPPAAKKQKMEQEQLPKEKKSDDKVSSDK